MKNLSVSPIILSVTAVAIAGGAFFGGMKYQQTKQTAVMGNFAQLRNFNQVRPRNGSTQVSQNRFGQGMRPINGEIIRSDDKSITVKLSDGSTKIVLISEKTLINKANEASKNDLISGEQVAVFGTQNNDGSVTAQNIQLIPLLRLSGNAPEGTPSATQ